MELTQDSIKEQIKAKEEDTKAFARTAQDDINKRNQVIQSMQMDLQNKVKEYQKEVDRREGAIEQLKALIGQDSESKE